MCNGSTEQIYIKRTIPKLATQSQCLRGLDTVEANNEWQQRDIVAGSVKLHTVKMDLEPARTES